jgi:hypothetical protein
MATLLLSLAAGFVLIASAITFQIARRRQSAARLKGLELRPNCLLTRYPIAFLSGRRSVFRLLDHWNDVPGYLHEHGYEVLILDPIGQGDVRTQSLLTALNALPGKCHLIADSSSVDEMNWLASSKHANISSLTLVRNGLSREPSKSRKGRAKQMGPSVSDLKPLSSAVEVFDVTVSGPLQRPSGWSNWAALLLLYAHNFILAFSYRHKKPVDPLETAELRQQNGWFLESLFLDLAISLAERDAQWCD